MSVAPHAGIVDFGTFTPPTSSVDGIQGEVPQPLAGQQNYVLTANGWVALSSLGTLVFQGTWDASTNTPTLVSSVGVQGYYYVVSVAGNTDLNGITTWTEGDWAIFSGSVWQKIEGGSTVNITGGTINGTTVGATNPSTGAFTTATASTSVTTPIVKATNSAGGALQNASGANQLQWGGGGGNNLSVDVAININPANSQVDISPTGTGTVRINPATTGTINNTTIGATTPSTGAFTTATASTSVTTPTVQATNSAGLALKNSAGTTQISMGAGGGDNVTVAVSTNLNGTNAQIDISPTGTGHVHIKPTGVNSVEIAPTYVGEMDNIVIGAVTPKAGTFTTITGQTGVLRGTGNNLLLQSNTFNTSWSTVASTIATTVATTDPFGGSNAWILTPTSSFTTGLTQTVLNSTGIYTLSLYAKAGTASWVRLFCNSSVPFAWFNLSTGVVGTVQSGGTATITDAGNGWYRCTISSTSNNTIGIRIADADSSTSGTTGQYIYIYGSQLEVGNTANTYIPTTTTAVYGTPTLSFSGVSEIGLLSNGALYLQPAGTGAIQAQATTSTTAGGNVRGANAVDWQTNRDIAGRVAGGTYAVVGGGRSNTCNGFNATVGGGAFNTASTQAGVVAGGEVNSASGTYSAIVGGNVNTSAGLYNFIGAGFTNSGTSGSAVTSQSGTMNATTAVTLSGSNASIKVGQYISGTSIGSDTYVAAISGTALTLSKVASGSSTSTLSFFTPHGVVVGGGNNQATGSYSFIGGGGDAGTAANRNTASGDWSVVAGGNRNVASGNFSFVGGGFTNTASATGAFIGGGGNFGSQTASGQGAFIGAGWSNAASGAGSVCLGIGGQANADYSSTLGGTYGNTRSIQGNAVFSASNAPMGTVYTNQAALLILARQTTDATPTALCSNSSAAGTTNQVILPNNSAYFFTGEVISGVTGGGNTKGWTIEGVIKRGANAASTALVGTPTVTSMYADVGAATWAIAVTADTTNGGLRVTFTGQASTTIRTVCSIRSTEMTF